MTAAIHIEGLTEAYGAMKAVDCLALLALVAMYGTFMRRDVAD